jgi:hypothetical protein
MRGVVIPDKAKIRNPFDYKIFDIPMIRYGISIKSNKQMIK